jgi:hypothetical protein
VRCLSEIAFGDKNGHLFFIFEDHDKIPGGMTSHACSSIFEDGGLCGA